MAQSGVAVDDAVVTVFNDIKLHKKHKYALYRISDDKKTIIVDCVGKKDATFDDFLAELKADQPRYAVVDFHYINDRDTPSDKIFFVNWCPEESKINFKMVHSASKDAIKAKLVGFGVELQATDMDEVSEDSFKEKIKDCKKSK